MGHRPGGGDTWAHPRRGGLGDLGEDTAGVRVFPHSVTPPGVKLGEVPTGAQGVGTVRVGRSLSAGPELCSQPWGGLSTGCRGLLLVGLGPGDAHLMRPLILVTDLDLTDLPDCGCESCTTSLSEPPILPT